MHPTKPRGFGRFLYIVLLIWAPFWLAYSYLVLNAVRQLGGGPADPLTHPVAALAYGALAMGLALLFTITAWWRIQTGWLRTEGLVSNLAVEVGHGLLFTAVWVASVEIIVVPLFYGESPFPLLDTLARTPYRSARIFNGLFLYTAAAGMAHAYRYFREAQASAVRAEQAERLATENRLAALRAQLQPHFLFNALNAISELVHQDSAAADDAILRLSRLLQRVLDEDREKQPLGEELEVIRDYLALERIRFGERLTFEESVRAEHLPLLVPSFAVHSLVENAVRHAVGPSSRPVRIRLSAERSSTGDLLVAVSDDGTADGGGEPGAGLGLKNLRARLSASYGDDAGLTTEPGAGGFRVILTLPCQVESHD